MFVYIVYETLKKKYCDAQKKFDEILNEKEALFVKTQPKSPNWDKISFSSQMHNSFDQYLMLKESFKVEERLVEIKSILKDREELLNLKEYELRMSKNHIDMVYRMRFLDQYNISKISAHMHYSESQIYRILQNIKGKCENMRENARKCEKMRGFS